MAPGMCPSRRVFPSNPRYSAGARASSNATVGRPEHPAHVRGREVHPVRATRRERRDRQLDPVGQAARDRPALGLPGGKPAVEDPDLFQPVGSQRPPHPRRVEALRVVVDHDRRPLADPDTGRDLGDPVWLCEPDGVGILELVDEVGPPVDVAGRRGSGRRGTRRRPFRPVASARPGPARPAGPGARPAIRSWRGARGGPGRTSSVSYGRGRPLPARCGPPGRGPGGPPRARGRHLPQHGLRGAAARRDGRGDERDRDLRADDGSRPHRLLGGDAPADGRGPGRGRRGPGRGRRPTSP